MTGVAGGNPPAFIQFGHHVIPHFRAKEEAAVPA